MQIQYVSLYDGNIALTLLALLLSSRLRCALIILRVRLPLLTFFGFPGTTSARFIVL